MRRVNFATREELVARILLGERIAGYYWAELIDDRLHAIMVNSVCAHPSDRPITLGPGDPSGEVCDDCLQVVARAEYLKIGAEPMPQQLTESERNLMTPMRKRKDGHEGFIWDAACHLSALLELQDRDLIKFVDRRDYASLWMLTEDGYAALDDGEA